MGVYRILLDCGLPRLSDYWAEFTRAEPIDLVFCSHAHADHAQGLLTFHQAFPQVPIYSSIVTAQLLGLNWPDEPEVEFCQTLPWQSEIEVKPGLTLTLIPSGHLPGAAAILLRYDGGERFYTLFYTGDFFLSNSRLVEGLPLGALRGLRPDVLILEGSYGTARYPHRRQLENQLAERIYQGISQGYSMLLPIPTLGLGQELLMLLRSHHYFTGQEVDIWVDGRVEKGCDRYMDLLPYFPTSVQNFAQHQPLFWDQRIRPRVRRYSECQGRDPHPCIVLTDETTDLNPYIQALGGEWRVLFAERPRIQLNPTSWAGDLQVQVETYFLSEHCDGVSTTQFIHNIRPQHVIFVHGAPPYLEDLTSLEELRNRYQLHSPAAGTLVELPLGELFLQPPLPEAYYSGELTEHASEVIVALPNAIIVDPRWQSLADTGLVEARWQGEELVLRGVSQRELLNQTGEMATELECCGNCHHYRSARCWNPASALYTFRVAVDGYCPVFEPRPLELE
ncbi:MAG: MBL fold metallo-hydrolase [Oscillatoriales cyanobacterium RM2_1_1]|nr:MBL fold metallo-hydrolase [Oscillatoriales cyanobacterium RM2_1_1]